MSDKILNAPEAVLAVDQLIASRALAPLRALARQRLGGAHCLVLGSAPGAAAPAKEEFDRLVCVNASPWVARALDLGEPDLLVLAGYTTAARKPVPEASMQRMAGLTSKWTLFVEVGQEAGEAQASLLAHDFAPGEFTPLDAMARAALIREACGEDLGLGPRDSRVSNGVFAILFALWSGAHKVVIAGMSLDGGHSYMREATPRHHQDGDRRCLELLAGDPRLATTSQELARDFGIGLLAGVRSIPSSTEEPAP